jgi:hypothetical protein
MPIHLVHASQTPPPFKLSARREFLSPRLKVRMSAV